MFEKNLSISNHLHELGLRLRHHSEKHISVNAHKLTELKNKYPHNNYSKININTNSCIFDDDIVSMWDDDVFNMLKTLALVSSDDYMMLKNLNRSTFLSQLSNNIFIHLDPLETFEDDDRASIRFITSFSIENISGIGLAVIEDNESTWKHPFTSEIFMQKLSPWLFYNILLSKTGIVTSSPEDPFLFGFLHWGYLAKWALFQKLYVSYYDTSQKTLILKSIQTIEQSKSLFKLIAENPNIVVTISKNPIV